MLCQFCKQREATIHFTNVENNKVNEIHICATCAEEQGFDELKKSNCATSDLVASLFDSAFAAVESGSTAGTCPNCGTSYSSFQDVGKLGCSHCYEHFRDRLYPLLRSIHGNTWHLGKTPRRFGAVVSAKRRIKELEAELERAVQSEQYELAAKIRDEIRRLAIQKGGVD
jgi:protein arginine kinase activator